MIKAHFNPTDRRYIFLEGDLSELRKLEEHLNRIPKRMFLPSFSGIPKPEVFLRKFKKGERIIYWCHSGLWHEVYSWCCSNRIVMEGLHKDDDFKYTSFDWSLEKFTDWVKGLGMTLDMREYQIKAAWLILKYRQSMSQLATRSGKTLIAYVVFRWLVEFQGAHNVLMIVPSTHLVRQGYNDMKDYKEFFKTETVWAKSELVEGSNLTIGTFTSLVNRLKRTSKHYNPKFFDKYDVVLCDECHKMKCKSIDMILSQPFMQHTKLKFGFSGTIPPENTIENFACQAMMGPIIQDITTKELIEAGYLADVEVEQVRIKYRDDLEMTDAYIKYGEYLCGNYVPDKENSKEKKMLPKDQQHFLVKYEKTLPYAHRTVKKEIEDRIRTAHNGVTQSSASEREIAFKREYSGYLTDMCKATGSNLLVLEQMITFDRDERVRTITNILEGSSKNFIVFGHHREYLTWLKKTIESRLPKKKCMLIIGKVKQKSREKIVAEMDGSDNCVLFASYSCVGTGLTFKNVDYGIFAESFKSEIINKQSLGRGLLLAPGKEKFKLYDIIDCLPTRRIEFQGNRKKKLFENEGFKVSVSAVETAPIQADGAPLLLYSKVVKPALKKAKATVSRQSEIDFETDYMPML